jgi:hypothetical protein
MQSSMQIIDSRALSRPIIMWYTGAGASLQLTLGGTFQRTSQAEWMQECVLPIVPAACDGDGGAQRLPRAAATPSGDARAAGSCSREVMASFW